MAAISKETSDAIIAEILSRAAAPSGVDRIIEDSRREVANLGCGIALPGCFEEYRQWIALGRI